MNTNTRYKMGFTLAASLLAASLTISCGTRPVAATATAGEQPTPGTPSRALPSSDTTRVYTPGPDEPGRFAFVPKADDFSPGALLDLRYLNEKVAGEAGPLKVDPATGDFLLGSGKPVRFWCVNTGVAREKGFTARPLGRKTEPDLARHARFLAKRGVNMVRLHAHVNPGADQPITAINEGDRDWIWRTVAAMKKEGVYTTISPYWANTTKFGASWNIPGGANQSTHGVLFFDETLQEAYKGWLRKLFAEKNPYTGISLAQDAGVGIIQLQNEDSLLFWTINNLGPDQKKRLGKKFGDWLKKKYGSLDAASTAWEGNKLPGDDAAAGVMDFHNIWEMTQNRSGGHARRLDDQLHFWSETMYDFNKKMATFLRNELGCKQLINAGNWRTADTARLNDAERWSYTANEVLAVNRYFGGLHVGKNNGWAVENGDEFTSISALKEPKKFPLNVKQAKGHPILVTESSWVMPNDFAAEGPFLISVYQSLTGVDGYFWFATGDDEWTEPESANGYMPSQGKWLFGNPDMLGTFPAAALMYRMGYIKRGEPVVNEGRALTDLWQRRTPVVSEEASFDPNRDAGNMAPTSSVKTPMPDEAFLAGPVVVDYGGEASKTKVADLSAYVNPTEGFVRSNTGQVRLNWKKGHCILNAPQAQGVAAFFKEQNAFKLSDVEITSTNEFGTVSVVSMDGKPLKTSGKVLVQVGTQSRPTGWKEAPTTIKVQEGSFPGLKVENYGKAPWQVIRPKVTLKVANATLKKATVLDTNGNAAGSVSLTKTANGVQFTFPETALYVVLQ